MGSSLDRPTTGLLLSGGLDSAILLGQQLAAGAAVVPFYVRTGCVWEAAEVRAVRRFLAAIDQPELHELVMFDMPLDDLYGNHWSFSGSGIPDERTPDEAVYLPGHNPLLLVKPAIWCRLNGVGQLALATLASNPFPDATPCFFAAFEVMLHEAMDGQVRITRPFAQLAKREVIQLGRDLPLEHTFSCLAAVDGAHCGHCNKCAERRRAFLEAGMEDPTEYALSNLISPH
jgi:7-cyano-7-deazaguanine synthase